VERTIRYRGSITDLATDVAFEISAEKGRELIEELERFLNHDKTKFQNAAIKTEEAIHGNKT
jgi:hypothetical protein